MFNALLAAILHKQKHPHARVLCCVNAETARFDKSFSCASILKIAKPSLRAVFCLHRLTVKRLLAAISHKQKHPHARVLCCVNAETARFELAIRFPVYTLSRRAPSTTRTRLLFGSAKLKIYLTWNALLTFRNPKL